MVWTSLEGFKHSGDLKLRPFKIWKNLKSGLFEVQISNGWASAMAIAVVPTIQNPVLGPFVRISNGWASIFQSPFKMWSICMQQPNHFSTIQNPDWSGFQIPNVFIKWSRMPFCFLTIPKPDMLSIIKCFHKITAPGVMFQIQVETDAQVPGSNPAWDYDIDGSELEITCHY